MEWDFLNQGSWTVPNLQSFIMVFVFSLDGWTLIAWTPPPAPGIVVNEVIPRVNKTLPGAFNIRVLANVSDGREAAVC